MSAPPPPTTTTATTKPTIVFIPGAWHLPDAYNTVRGLLAQRGFPSEAIALPSIGAEPPTKSLNNDIEHVHAVLKRLVEDGDEGRQVVVVCHSYGGLVGAGAVKGLEFKRRNSEGSEGSKGRGKGKGGVIMLVYMSAFVVPRGKSLKDMLGGEWLGWMRFDGNYSRSSNEETVFYNDLPPAEQARWISKLTHISARVFTDPATHEPWNNDHHYDHNNDNAQPLLPCMYLFCDKDQALPIAMQEQMAGAMGAGLVATYRSEASHSPFLSVPEQVVEGLEMAARVGAERSGVGAGVRLPSCL
ncbi:hypothetical protein VTN00DRAFT_2932 [Thermoascus crustaceus]|uniref:uncharacterized protein n=1 Tax=Thermoascus crustaceus TaxID=5088 RepID=UPI003742F8C4